MGTASEAMLLVSRDLENAFARAEIGKENLQRTPQAELWFSVVERAVKDYLEGKSREHVRTASAFLFEPGDGLEIVCELLDIDADRIRLLTLARSLEKLREEGW